MPKKLVDQLDPNICKRAYKKALLYRNVKQGFFSVSVFLVDSLYVV